MAGTLGPIVQTQQVLERVATPKVLYAMGVRGFTVTAAYEDGCWEWVFTVVVPVVAPGQPDVVVEHRDKNPETAWRRVIVELQDRRLWDLY